MKNPNHPQACPQCHEVNDCVCIPPKYDTRHAMDNYGEQTLLRENGFECY
jgi:hypothetical protein